MKNKVYVVVEEHQFDSGDCGESVEVFSNLENAKLWKKCLSNLAKKDFNCFSEIDEEDEEMYYVICEKGEYCYNHITITIYEKEIDIKQN